MDQLLVDIFTKPLDKEKFEKFNDGLGFWLNIINIKGGLLNLYV